MKTIKTLYVFIVLLSISLNVVIAQNTQPTPYQKKQLELSKKWFQILSGYELSMSDEVFYEQILAGKEANDFVLGMAILNYAMTNSKSQCEKIFTQMNNEFKQAEKLKNANDFRFEKEVKALKEKKEKEQKLLKEQEAYDQSDIGDIKKNIKLAINQWNQKGEFEKETNYSERMQKKSQTAFDSICLEKIKSKINSFSEGYWEKELSIYNSEKEFFTVFFKINGVKWQSSISIPITKAQKFKTDWPFLEYEIDGYDWCLVENTLCPTIFTLKNRENVTYKFPLSVKNQSDISFLFDDLGIENPYLKGYVFKYSNAKAIDEQIEKENYLMDSLELTYFNQKLDSIFKDYNRKLLQNPYNTNKKVIREFKTISVDLSKGYYDQTISQTRQKKYNDYQSEMERGFINMNNSFERELESSNPIEYCKIYFSQNPEKKKEADKKYMECRCNYTKREDFDLKFISGNLTGCNCRKIEYRKNGNLFTSKEEFDGFYEKGDDVYFAELEKRTVLNYLTNNTQYIESMDFRKEKKESVGSVLGRGLLKIATNSNISAKDYADENEIRKNILSIVQESQNKPYYIQVVDIIVVTNKRLYKEWAKNGQYFEDKAEFYTTYLSEDYKSILKEKRKNKEAK